LTLSAKSSLMTGSQLKKISVMKLTSTILYVPCVEKAMEFYTHVFGLQEQFITECKQYGEMDTGSLTLAFVSESWVQDQNPSPIQPSLNRLSNAPGGFELNFTTDNVEQAYQSAVSKGATALFPPKLQPWGQTVAFVRDLNGVIVEISSPHCSTNCPSESKK
jgi:lactoylglutathione lyase